MTYEAKLSLSDEDVKQLEEEAAFELALDFASYWAARSKSPKKFYIRMSKAVSADGNNVVVDGSDGGLAKWISDKRGIVDDFLQGVELIQEKRIVVKKYNL